MKRKTLLIFTVLLIASLLASGSKAYLYAEGKATNKINSGNIDITIYEREDAEFTAESTFPTEVYPVKFGPDSSVAKYVFVKNTGEYDAWIRVKITICPDSITKPDDPAAEYTPAELAQIITLKSVDDGGDVTVPAVYFGRLNAEDEILNAAKVAVNGDLTNVLGSSNWYTKNNADGEWDGWYYYKEMVPPNGTTRHLLTGVEFGKVTEEFQNKIVTLVFDAQGVQYVNNKTTVLEAGGWPTE